MTVTHGHFPGERILVTDEFAARHDEWANATESYASVTEVIETGRLPCTRGGGAQQRPGPDAGGGAGGGQVSPQPATLPFLATEPFSVAMWHMSRRVVHGKKIEKNAGGRVRPPAKRGYLFVAAGQVNGRVP
jgi:hypothetical protein